MNIKPLADRVLILPQPAEEKTIGGIIIPDTAKEKPLQGKVVAVGNGTKDEEMLIAVGDQVLYGKSRGSETSQYPKEKRSNDIAQVAASESAGAQTGKLASRGCGTRTRYRKG